MAVDKREHFVQSGADRLAVTEYGDGPVHVVLVHGYPDDQTLWKGVVDRLEVAERGLHAVTYDVRGAGRSSVPPRIRDYRNQRLTDDLVAVVEATVPAGERFHLVGHDWGSIQSWDSLRDPRLADRILSFVSVSGPSIDHAATLFRRRPSRSLLGQVARSLYIGLFQAPLAPELMWRSQHRLTPTIVRLLAAQGGESAWSPRLAHNAEHGVQLYRANMMQKLLRPRPERVDLPVVLVEALQDAFVGKEYVDVAEQHCSDVRRLVVDAPHWHPLSQPALLAGILTEHLVQDSSPRS